MVSLILAGMTMLFFPPVSGVGGILLATGITLAAGSICAGFTKRLATTAYNICKPPAQKIFGWVRKKIFTQIPNPVRKKVSKSPEIRIPSPMTYENLIPALSTKDSFEVPVKRGEKTPPIDIPHKSSKNTSKISPCSFMHTGAHHFLNCRGKPSSSHVPTISPKIASGST